MPKCPHWLLITISGLVWMAVGLYLMPLGIDFLLQAGKGTTYAPILDTFSFLARETVALILLVGALALGYCKSKWIFSKTVQKGVAHIRSLPNPAPLHAVYTIRYLLLLAVMVFLGISLKYFKVPLDIRGFVDVTIGAALINGAMLYFRSAQAPSPQS